MKRSKVLGLLLAGIFCVAQSSAAYEIQNKFALLLDGGLITYGNAGAVYLAKDFSGADVPVSNFMGRLGGLYGISPNIQLGVEVEFLNIYTQSIITMDRYEIVGGVPVATGTFDASLKYWLPTGTINLASRGMIPITPDINIIPTVGIGYAIEEFRVRYQIDTQLVQEMNCTYHGINIKATIGGEYRLTELLAVGIEAGYRFLALLDTPDRSSFTNRKYDDLSGLIVIGGIRMYL